MLSNVQIVKHIRVIREYLPILMNIQISPILMIIEISTSNLIIENIFQYVRIFEYQLIF